MDDWQRARLLVTKLIVIRADDLGRFVNNTDYFRPSQLAERASMPVLLQLLPTVSNAKLTCAIAGRLRRLLRG